jgi:hypothetical protein
MVYLSELLYDFAYHYTAARECLILDIRRLIGYFTPFLCTILTSTLVFVSFMTEQGEFFPRKFARGGEMSIAVPIILAVALAVSLSGQVGRFWPTYQSDQDENSKKQDDGEKQSEKSKSAQGSSSKIKNSDRSSSAATSKGKRDIGSKGQD